jgi:hypothetical protein
MALFIQVAVWGAMLAYLWQCRAYMHRRNRADWASLAAQLGYASTSGNASLGIDVLAAANEEIQSKSLGRRGAWMRFNNARVVLEMADYAERNNAPSPASIDLTLLISQLTFVRRDAMQLRIAALVALVKCTFLL